MVILYGLGSYSRNIAKKYNILMDEIEVIIDNALSMYEAYHGMVISWEEYLLRRTEYHSKQLVIGAQYRFDEIKKEVLESGLFEEADIIEIEKWAKENFSEKQLLGWYIDEQECMNVRHISEYVGSIPQEQLKEAMVLCSRYEALERLPKGGYVAEIGVAYGDFSKEIITRMKPKKFYAVDLFCESIGFWNNGVFKEAQMTHYE